MNSNQTNEYLEQVVQQKASVDRELRKRAVPRRAPSAVAGGLAGRQAQAPQKEDLDVADSGRAVDYRITGFWWWKTVIVPPNVHVVHTRRGRSEPMHIGLGQSFRYNPHTDSFLLIPAAVQTLIINANCICRELQGVMVQAYVQWVVADVSVAYRRLDFSDVEDPMHIVNVQLREQAEAALKDKVSTMSIHEVLSDKQPLIEELTQRLRQVAEGAGDAGSEGLGLKIVTVQLKEAVVSSTRLWENLQRPFRAEREKLARMAELESQRQISARELEYKQATSFEEIAVEDEIGQRSAAAAQSRFDREHAEAARRQELQQRQEQETLRQRNELELLSREADAKLQTEAHRLEIDRLERERALLEVQLQLEEVRARRAEVELSAELQRQQMREGARLDLEARAIANERARRAVENDITDAHVRARLIERLPEIAGALPTPDELKAISLTGADPGIERLAGMVSAALEVGLPRIGRGEG